VSKVYNRSKERVEAAVKVDCPRCRGFGAISSDDGENCWLCGGDGILWASKDGTGWHRRIGKRLDASQLY